MKLIMSMTLVMMMGSAFAQSQTSTVINSAQEELLVLEQIDTKYLTKAEKKALKRKKRTLKRIIRTALYSEAQTQQMLLMGSPYLRNGVYLDAFGRPVYVSQGFGHPYGYYPRRVVTPRRPMPPPRCVVPQRNTRTRR